MFFSSSFQQHLFTRQFKIHADSSGKQPLPKAVAKRKAAPPPPPRKSIAKAEFLPKWEGPCPAAGWKAERVVNWTPIRQASRLQGSIWEGVSKSRSQAPMPEHLVDGLNRTFMCKVSDAPKHRKAIGRRSAVLRLFPRQQALQADILHAKLIRLGIKQVEELAWVIGSMSSCPCTRQVSIEEGIQEEGVSRAGSMDALEDGNQLSIEEVYSRPEPVTAEVLELLLHMLRLISDQELEVFVTRPTEAPSEIFLQKLLAGPCKPKVLKNWIQAAYYMARFGESETLQKELERGLNCIRRVVDSKALPVLLEGVLLIGNYVNSSSPFLSGALGITLQSLAGLATARCKKDRGVQQVNAFQFVVGHLQRTTPDFIACLARDLDDCRVAQSLDETTLISAVEGLITQVKTVEQLTLDSEFVFDGAMPEALSPERLQDFLTTAIPKVTHLSELIRNLDVAAKDLRTWFAEPNETRLVDMLGYLVQIREALPSSLAPEGKTDNAPVVPKRSERQSKCEGPKRKSRALTAFSITDDSNGDVQVNPDIDSADASLAAVVDSDNKVETEEESTRADSEVAPSVREEGEDMFEAALRSLTQAVSYIQSAKAPLNHDSMQWSDEADFEAPLSTLESVLARLTVADDRVSNSETASECSEAPTAACFYDLDDLPDDVGELISECDVFERPLADLESIVARLKRPRAKANNNLQRCKASPTECLISDDAYRNFEAPLAELQLLCSQMSPQKASPDSFEKPLADLQAVQRILRS